MSITKEESQNNFACSSCTKTFTKLDILKRHIKRVHETPTFKCGSCGKLFIRSDFLKRHEKSVHLIFLHRPTTKTSIIFVRHNQNVFAVVFDFADGEHADAYP